MVATPSRCRSGRDGGGRRAKAGEGGGCRLRWRGLETVEDGQETVDPLRLVVPCTGEDGGTRDAKGSSQRAAALPLSSVF